VWRRSDAGDCEFMRVTDWSPGLRLLLARLVRRGRRPRTHLRRRERFFSGGWETRARVTLRNSVVTSARKGHATAGARCRFMGERATGNRVMRSRSTSTSGRRPAATIRPEVGRWSGARRHM